tara:strand:- start:2682 stop:4991 length:2310 start_codon:yes stop_codon:yes gene_type:complete
MKNIMFLIWFVSSLFSYELYKEIKINHIDQQLISTLHQLHLHLDHVQMKPDNSIQFAISQSDLNKLDSHHISYIVIHEDLEAFYVSRLTNDMESRDFEYGSMGGYYTWNEIVENLDELFEDYPNLVAEKISIGQSLEGRDIWAIKMSDNPNIDEDEAEVLYTGLHHAREPMSYMNLFYYMNWLVENYGTDQMATDILDNRELWFIPALNPDGLVYNQQIAPNGGGMQRKNGRETCNGYGADGVDLNRNYSFMWGLDDQGSSSNGCDETYRGTGPFSEPETSAMAAFIEQHEFPIALNYHSYSNLLIYPFGYSYDNPMEEDDLNTFIEIGQELVSVNGYELGTGPDLLYPVNGEACDWMYGVHGIFAYTPEVGSSQDGFWPSTNRIIPLCEENLYANQYLALVAGSNYSSDISVSDDSFIQGESYPLNISIKNSGLSSSSGDIHIDILSSSNLIFELSEIIIDELEAGENLDLGNIAYFEISQSTPEGSIEEIIVNVYDNYNVISSSSISILIGEPETLISDEFETQNSWAIGDSDDNATNGIWERAIPNPTYDDNGQLIQPNSDHTENGEFCFVTNNAVSNDNSEFGYGDVDGGKTTLLSPVYDLSDYSVAAVSYWRWYSNSAAGGANPGNDVWRVDASNDGGNSWHSLEATDEDSNSWIRYQFILNDETLSLSNQMKFRFIAEDIYYDGDNGSGGSIVEAAVDDFKILVFNDAISGDANYDGELNILDIVLIVNMILEVEDTDLVADMNNDGGINIQDIVLLLNLILS